MSLRDAGLPAGTARLWRCGLDAVVLPQPALPGIRLITPGDAPALGRLIQRSFAGTDDDHGLDDHGLGDHGLDDQLACSKVGTIIDARSSVRVAQASLQIVHRGRVSSACLTARHAPDGAPVIMIIATDPGQRRRGLAAGLLTAALRALQGLGEPECRAMISRGNAASERLFTALGFTPDLRTGRRQE